MDAIARAHLGEVKRKLADVGLMSSDWGGDTEFVEVSAKQKTNLNLLLEMICLVADMGELKAAPERPATGTVLWRRRRIRRRPSRDPPPLQRRPTRARSGRPLS